MKNLDFSHPDKSPWTLPCDGLEFSVASNCTLAKLPAVPIFLSCCRALLKAVLTACVVQHEAEFTMCILFHVCTSVPIVRHPLSCLPNSWYPEPQKKPGVPRSMGINVDTEAFSQFLRRYFCKNRNGCPLPNPTVALTTTCQHSIANKTKAKSCCLQSAKRCV